MNEKDIKSKYITGTNELRLRGTFVGMKVIPKEGIVSEEWRLSKWLKEIGIEDGDCVRIIAYKVGDTN